MSEHIPKGGGAPGLSIDNPVTAVSVLLFNGDEMAMGVRVGNPLEDRHLGVLSTFTRGFTRRRHALLEGGDAASWPEGIHELGGQPEFTIGRGEHSVSDGADAVEQTLGKAGLTDALATGRMQGVGRAVGRSLMRVEDPWGTNRAEWTAMLTYAVDLTAGAEQLPGRTGSYDPLVWIAARRLPEAFRANDILQLGLPGSFYIFCVDGLCVRGAVHYLDRRFSKRAA